MNMHQKNTNEHYIENYQQSAMMRAAADKAKALSDIADLTKK